MLDAALCRRLTALREERGALSRRSEVLRSRAGSAAAGLAPVAAVADIVIMVARQARAHPWLSTATVGIVGAVGSRIAGKSILALALHMAWRWLRAR